MIVEKKNEFRIEKEKSYYSKIIINKIAMNSPIFR
jgi:hypothetical protein